uniref:AB hydrolase-1 domain-containing protein n=1 Tax=Leptobrachium leishanense TaxID=445787 RepID=A0A8C5MYH2_9ANUR
SCLKGFALGLIVVYVTVPFIIRLFPMLLSKVVYLNMVKVPLSVDLSNPGELLNHTINFYLTPEEGITVGVWHTVPTNRGEEAKGKDLRWFEDSLSDNNPVIIYLHGNGGTRALDHRVQLIKHLSWLLYVHHFHSFPLFAGFADSTGEPSEEGVTQDSAFIYQWVKARSRGNPVCLWGHSLGSGCVSHVVPLLYVRIPSLGHPDVLICAHCCPSWPSPRIANVARQLVRMAEPHGKVEFQHIWKPKVDDPFCTECIGKKAKGTVVANINQ